MTLKRELEALLQSAAGTWAVVLRDGAGIERFGWNGDAVLSSASLIKVSLAWQLLESTLPFDQIHPITAESICDPDGSLAALVGESLPLIELARVMITESENSATNIVLDQLGGLDGANRWLHERGYRHTRWGRRMLDFVARAAGRDNTTSAREMAEILYQLAVRLPTTPQLAPLQEWLMTALCSEKLELGLPVGTPLAHKVGDLPDAEHDAGIITLPNGDWYVLVVLAAGIPNGETARATIAEISRRCWRAMQ